MPTRLTKSRCFSEGLQVSGDVEGRAAKDALSIWKVIEQYLDEDAQTVVFHVRCSALVNAIQSTLFG